jgi:hypothetical protein
MPSAAPALLYELDDHTLARAAEDGRYPKWSTMCRLRLLGHPVLNACCVEPAHGTRALRGAARRLSAAVGTDRLLLRSDGGIETTRYYRGGNTFLLGMLEARAAALLRAGRAVVLTEPTNRFTNRLSAVLRIDRDHRHGRGSFNLEALGPGYDVSDLNRGGIQPQLTIAVHDVDWWHYRELWWSDLQVTIRMGANDQDHRRRQRLLRLATDILPEAGETLPDKEPATAEVWLRARGYLGLWQPWDPMVVVRGIRRWYDDAFILGNTLRARNWRCLSLPLSNLGRGRTVYWDIVDGQRKHGLGAPRRQFVRCQRIWMIER